MQTIVPLRFLAEESEPSTAYVLDPQTLLAIAEDAAAMQARCDALSAEASAESDPVTAGGKASRAGMLCLILGRAGDAERLCEFALERQTDSSQARSRAVTEIRLAQAVLRLGRGEEAVERLVRVADRSRQQSELSSLLHFALQHLGKAYWELGRFDEARVALLEALALRQAARDEQLVESTRMALRLLPEKT